MNITIYDSPRSNFLKRVSAAKPPSALGEAGYDDEGGSIENCIVTDRLHKLGGWVGQERSEEVEKRVGPGVPRGRARRARGC